MLTVPFVIDDLLDPISMEHPAGEDLRWTPEWDRIREARRAEDGLKAGKWEKKERKSSDWPVVQELSSAMLRTRSKDLQLALWLTEASVKLGGFEGLRDGLRLVRELMIRFWDAGLFPVMEDGPGDRVGPFDWLNEKLVDSILALPITNRLNEGPSYNLLTLQDARRVGSEASWKASDGEIDDDKKKAYDAAIAAGRISLDMFNRVVKDTKRAEYEVFSAEFEEAYEEFKRLDRLVDEKFGPAAPNLKSFRGAMNDIKGEISSILETKRKQEPGLQAPNQSNQTQSGQNQKDNGIISSPQRDAITLRFPLLNPNSPGSQSTATGSWQEAERLVYNGQVDAGLSQMTRLAAAETSGRSRFERKLLLAQVCLTIKRERLARTILEELGEQIDKFQLECWESSELIGGVWARLYELYKGGDSSDADRAAKLYERLCRLDPWQALACSD